MKYLLMFSFLFSFGAKAESLDQLINNQTVVSISPVEYQGFPIHNTGGTVTAAKLCALLGFTFLKSSKAKVVTLHKGHNRFATIQPASGLSVVNTYWVEISKEQDASFELDVLDEVVCAR